MASNYSDVLDQLRAAGLIVDGALRTDGKLARCKVEGDREHRGWYILHEITTGTGDTLIVGSFGVWRGNDNGAQKIEVRKSEFSAEQRAAIRARQSQDRKRAEADRQREADRAAARARAAWDKCSPTGESEYLARKGVAAHGVRFSPSGALAVPMLDAAGRIHGLQIIRSRAGAKADRAPEKQYWPAGVAVKAHFHLIGLPTWIVLIAEGYATGASLHEATGLPVAIAFDAGNLAPVAAELHLRYRSARILICADDDSLAKCPADGCHARFALADHPTDCPACGKTHSRRNTGVTDASTAAMAVDGAFAVPIFTDEAGRRARFVDRGVKITDFNDLHAAEGLHVVRAQIEARITELGWREKSRPSTTTAGAGGEKLRPIESIDEMLERYSLVYGSSGGVFDHREHALVANSDVRDACMTKYLHRAWMEHPLRNIVRKVEVGFDPGGKDGRITCNMWGGWPTKPAAGNCEKMLELLRHMCSAESKSAELYAWTLRWLAYPIQHPGAKMKSCVVIHGPQGTGKNLFFEECVAPIYGEYARVIDQDSIEDKFNDWASRKLFLIADEVLARSEIYHVKNKLKRFVTGDTIRINPKNMSAWEERNHVNVVFLSNESKPLVLEDDDRRHAVLWTPRALDADFYAAVVAEIRAGGVAALHDYLLNLDLADFGEHTRPPMTDAKQTLIGLNQDNTLRFYYELCDGDIPGVKAVPCLTRHLYECYRTWCQRGGYKAASISVLLDVFQRKCTVKLERTRYTDEYGGTLGPHAIAMLGGRVRGECPPGRDEMAWLGENIRAFAKSIEDESRRREAA